MRIFSYEELDELGEGLIRQYLGKEAERTCCVDIEGFVTDFLKLPLLYRSFAEEDSDKIGFIADGVTPLRVYEGGTVVRRVYPGGTIVIERCLRLMGRAAPLQVATEQGDRSVAGTLFSNGDPRLVEMFGIKVEADLDGYMLYIVNEDAPGFIGRIGTALGEAGLNIGTFHLGRRAAGGEAVLLLSLDSPMPEPLLWQLCQLPGVKTVKGLKF